MGLPTVPCRLVMQERSTRTGVRVVDWTLVVRHENLGQGVSEEVEQRLTVGATKMRPQGLEIGRAPVGGRGDRAVRRRRGDGEGPQGEGVSAAGAEVSGGGSTGAGGEGAVTVDSWLDDNHGDAERRSAENVVE